MTLADAVPRLITALPLLPSRPRDAHKGSFGRVLVVAGSRGMSGAAVLCGSAALRGGAGLVRVAVPHGILPTVAAANPCYMTAPLAEDDHGRVAADALPALLELAHASTVVAIGPGLGQGEGPGVVVKELLARINAPVVLDADGLNALGSDPSPLRGRTAPLILTPHPGEFARLLGSDTAAVQADRQSLAVRFAEANRVVLVLKGQGTVVTDGTRLYVNTTGNPGMATGGSGDVLTGVIAALAAQRLEPFEAAQLGVFLHGCAGDLAAAHLGEVGLIAADLLDQLPRAVRSLP
jgi:ADP-dependent NAD(P)H-hydrate dehydratase